MNSSLCTPEIAPSYPRYFRIGRYWVSSYKIFFSIGIYTAVLVCAAVGQDSGIPPLRMGLGCLASAFAAMVGSRLYHLVVFARHYANERFWSEVWNPRRGGWSVFGGLLAIVPYSFLLAAWLPIPVKVCWDHMVCGIVAGALWLRFACICNGCCYGKPTTRWYGLTMHDYCGTRRRRIPVQWLEIGWWLLAGAGLIWLWPMHFAPGTYALGVVCWYGFGRFWLEPLRETPDRIAGRVRINRAVAALLAIGAGGALLVL